MSLRIVWEDAWGVMAMERITIPIPCGHHSPRRRGEGGSCRTGLHSGCGTGVSVFCLSSYLSEVSGSEHFDMTAPCWITGLAELETQK